MPKGFKIMCQIHDTIMVTFNMLLCQTYSLIYMIE